MTTRERHMSIILTGFILVAGVGFFGYTFIISPLKAQRDQIDNLDRDIEERKARIARVAKRQVDEEKWKKLSLPADQEKKGESAIAAPGKTPTENVHADIAQQGYYNELDKLCKAAGYSPADYVIIPKKPDAKNSPQLANRKPIYTKLVFTVQLKGDLASLVDFMDRFYKVHLLHQIRNMTIQKPLGADIRAAPVAPPAGGAPGGNNNPQVNTPSTDLDVNLTIEALVLDTAEQRKDLLPDKTVEVPRLLARSDEQYAMIPGKNMFFGPVPTGPSRGDRDLSYFNPAPFISLTGITSSEYGFEATLWDRINGREFRIWPQKQGGYKVDLLFTLRGTQRSDPQGESLSLRNGEGGVEAEWTIIRIDPRDVILRDEKGKYFALHMDDRLSKPKELSRSDLEVLGIKVEPVKEKPKAVAPVDPDNP
jgi:hypothetical protein